MQNDRNNVQDNARSFGIAIFLQVGELPQTSAVADTLPISSQTPMFGHGSGLQTSADAYTCANCT